MHGKAALLFGVTGVVGALVGSQLTHLVSEPVLLLIFAGLMIVVALRMFRARPEGSADEHAEGHWFSCAATGLFVGVLTGFLGVGGGFLIVPALLFLTRVPLKRAIATSLVIITVTSGAGLLGHLRRTHFDWGIALMFLGLAIIGMLAGREFARHIQPNARVTGSRGWSLRSRSSSSPRTGKPFAKSDRWAKKIKMKHSAVAWLAIALLTVACSKHEKVPPPPVTAEKAPADETPHWLTDFEAAKGQARAEKKLLLMEFTGSDWCPPCMMLAREVLSQPVFTHYAAQHLVLLEVDFPRRKNLSEEQRAANTKIAQQYGIEGFPTIIVLDAEGKPLGKFGYVPGLSPEKVIEVLEKARTENAGS